MTRKILFFFKSTLSVGILCLLVVSTDLKQLQNVLVDVDLRYLSIVITLCILGMVVSAFKWQSLLVVDGINCKLWTLVRYYLIGIYFNNFLPTSIGGDAMRAWLVSSRYNRGLPAITSVFAERFSGLIALLLVAGVLSLNGNLFPTQRWLGVSLILAVSALVLLFKVICWKRLLMPLPDNLCAKIETLFSSFSRYLNDRRALCIMGWTSLIYPFLVGLVYYFAGQAFLAYIPFFDLVVISSLVTLLTLVPVSLNGLGLREGGFVYFLGLHGILQAQALSITLLVFGLTLLLSLLGGILLLFERGRSENDRLRQLDKL